MRTKGATSLTTIKLAQLLAHFGANDDIVVGRKFFESVKGGIPTTTTNRGEVEEKTPVSDPTPPIQMNIENW